MVCLELRGPSFPRMALRAEGKAEESESMYREVLEAGREPVPEDPSTQLWDFPTVYMIWSMWYMVSNIHIYIYGVCIHIYIVFDIEYMSA